MAYLVTVDDPFVGERMGDQLRGLVNCASLRGLDVVENAANGLEVHAIHTVPVNNCLRNASVSMPNSTAMERSIPKAGGCLA